MRIPSSALFALALASPSPPAGGTTFTTTAAGDTVFVTHDYCVEGNTMHLVSLDPTMTGPSGQPAIIFDIIAQRR